MWVVHSFWRSPAEWRWSNRCLSKRWSEVQRSIKIWIVDILPWLCYKICIHLNDGVIAQTTFGALQQRRSINEQRSLSLVDNEEITVAAQLYGSLSSRNLMSWSFEGQVYVDRVILGGATEADLWYKGWWFVEYASKQIL